MSATAKKDGTFPQIMAAAFLVGGLVWLVDQYDRKAASIFAVTLLGGIALSRDLAGTGTDLIDAITGKKG